MEAARNGRGRLLDPHYTRAPLIVSKGALIPHKALSNTNFMTNFTDTDLLG